jgi:hypothetical protein
VDSRVRRVTWALLGVALGGLVGSLLLSAVVVAQIRTDQVDRKPQLAEDSATLALIKDCTEPGGECFKRGQKRTAEAVGNINQVIVAAAACAAGVDARLPVDERLAFISNCVAQRLTD